MHYLYSITGNEWFDDFVGSPGYATFVDMRTGNTVLVTHGSADGHLPYVEEANEWELLATVDQVVCCYPGMVQQRYPMLNVLGNWRSPIWVTPLYSLVRNVHLVEILSDKENTKYYGTQ